MKIKNQLHLVIAVLITQTVLIVASIAGIPLWELGGGVFHMLYVLLEIVALIFLYSFVVKHYLGKIHVAVILIISTLKVYGLLGSYFFLNTSSLKITPNEQFLQAFLMTGLPAFIILICELILAFQLYNNTVENAQAQHNIRLIGKAYLVTIIALFASPVLSFFIVPFVWIDKVVGLISLLPIILMLKMYWEELKRLEEENG